MDVGTTLRVARERRNLTVAQLASTTKIPASVLQAIEDNAFDRVPRGIFVRGFLRAYAREVGLDPEDLIAQFLEETVETAPADETVPPREAIDDEIGVLQVDPDLSGSRPGWGYALIVAALVVGIVSFNRSNTSDEPPAASAVAEVAAAPDDVVASAQEVKAIATTGGALRFEMEARGECWVKAVVDGRTLVARLLQPGERITTDVEHDVVLRVGDPAALTYSINGRPGPALGTSGTPVTVRFTSDGQQDLLAL